MTHFTDEEIELTYLNFRERLRLGGCTALDAFKAALSALRPSAPPAADLPTIPALTLINEARGHLGAAIHQSLPSDDKIIMEHVRAAEGLLRLIQEAKS